VADVELIVATIFDHITILRTRRLETPSMPVSSSPSWAVRRSRRGAASTLSCEVPNVDAIQNLRLPEQRDAFEDSSMQRAVQFVCCRKLIDLAVIGIEDCAIGPFILGRLRQSPDDRLPTLGGALGYFLHPDNPAAD
jgi:hypothetical protein